MKRFPLIVMLVFGVAFIMTGLTSCNQTKAKNNSHYTTNEQIKKPDSLFMSPQDLAGKVQARAEAAVREKQNHFVKEALESVSETNETLKSLLAGNVKAGKKQLQLALNNAKTALKKNPGVKLIPVNISVNSRSFVADMQQVNQIVQEAKKAMDKGYYQEASSLLEQVKSEVQITTVSLPLKFYPSGLEQADSLLKANQTKNAENVLYGLLGSLEITQVILPVPILRAEALISTAQNIPKGKDHAKKTLNLLENANYQLHLAQTMGYGNFDKEYNLLSGEIKEVEQKVHSGYTKSDIFINLSNKLDKFKDRLFGKGIRIR